MLRASEPAGLVRVVLQDRMACLRCFSDCHPRSIFSLTMARGPCGDYKLFQESALRIRSDGKGYVPKVKGGHLAIAALCVEPS